MAHHSSGGGGGGGGGIEEIAPPTGPFTAFLGLGLFFLAVRFAWKHPKAALKGVMWSGVFAFVLSAFGGLDGNPVAHPGFGMLAIIVGFCICPSEKAVRNSAKAKATTKEN
jgi:peptidoglycan/LPS O-acetylase OafA/YrhL